MRFPARFPAAGFSFCKENLFASFTANTDRRFFRDCEAQPEGKLNFEGFFDDARRRPGATNFQCRTEEVFRMESAAVFDLRKGARWAGRIAEQRS